MKDHLAYCGINCASCKLYQATYMNDIELKLEVANEWGALYKREFEIESFFCYGCKSERTFELCVQCDIKVCNQKRNLRCCPECSEYPCDRIKEFRKYQSDNNTGVK